MEKEDLMEYLGPDGLKIRLVLERFYEGERIPVADHSLPYPE